ncbi:MAG: hypothetical protein IJ455_01830 [Agathobacter sp.]|nr:hypothetical protein [Agathobacter sp.]
MFEQRVRRLMYNVDGFLFEDEATAKLARKEEEGIRFIKERTALDNPEVVLKLYKKLLEQELFVTPVGIRFLTELQNILLSSVYIARDEIPPIPVKAAETAVADSPVTSVEKAVQKPVEAVKKVNKKVDDKVGGNYKKPFFVALFFAIVFAISVIGMFAINAISGNNINIINYREQLLNEYSSWEAELKTEEERLEKWEELLEERENQLREDMNGGE